MYESLGPYFSPCLLPQTDINQAELHCTASLSPALYAWSSSSLSSIRRGWCRASVAELWSCLIENGSSSRREKSVPAMMTWNQGKPVETSMSSSTHEDKPTEDQPTSPSAARPPYWRGVNAARVSRARSRASDSDTVEGKLARQPRRE
jgi:hypothetical protein